MSTTLLLSIDSWDLTLDANGNVAVATGALALAQDAASAIRLVQGELWYDVLQGVPYFAAILGLQVPPALAKQKFVAAAKTVPGVASAKVFISAVVDRKLSGQVQITTTTGQVAAASF